VYNARIPGESRTFARDYLGMSMTLAPFAFPHTPVMV
jgi:hypothetical protein